MKPEAYEPHNAISKIRLILNNNGRLIVRRHCYERMGQRTVDDLDIRKVLEENGTIKSKPEWDEKHQKYKYKVDGFDTEGEQLSVVVNIIEEDWIVITITVFGK